MDITLKNALLSHKKTGIFYKVGFEEQVLKCLKLSAADQAPAPDGFTMGFSIKCWEVVKRDIMKAMQNFPASL